MTLPSDWYGVAGILIVQFFIFMQSRRNGATAKEAASEAKEVGTQVNDIKGAVTDVQAQVTNGGNNLATVIGQINQRTAETDRRTRLIELYLENLPNQQDISGVRGDLRRIDGHIAELGERVTALEGRDGQ